MLAAKASGGGGEGAFELAFRASPAAMAISSLADSSILDVNDAAARLVGCTRAQLIGHRGDALGLWLDPAERVRVGAIFAERGAVHDYATKMRRRDGELLDVVLSVQPVTMFGQRCALTVLNDVTALRAAERTLDEAQAIGKIGSFCFDVRDEHVEFSKEARRILGAPTSGANDADWRQLLDASNLTAVLAARERAIGETGVFEGEYPIVRPSGERRIIFAHGRVEHDANGRPVRLVGVLQDVTEQREARDELRRSQRLFATAFRESPVPKAILSDGGGIEDINDSMAALLGRPARDLLGRTTLDANVWFDLADRDRMHRELAEHGRVARLEVRLCHPDGPRHVIMSVSPIDVGGQTRLLAVVTDVTGQRRAEQLLDASEERCRRIIETTAQGVMTDDGERITFANHRAAELLATTVDALVGRPLRDFLPPEARAQVAAARERRRAGLTDTYDLTLMSATGERVLVEVNASPLRNSAGGFEGTLAMFSDVRLRRQADDARARLAAIVESSRDAITSFSLDGTIQTWNAAAERLYGYPAARAIGMNTAVLVPQERRAAHAVIMAQLQRGELVAIETTCIRQDGTRADIVLTCSPVLDATGAVVAISSIARDISAQRHAQKMEAIGSLAGGIAHDFNNILCVVLSSATLIEDALGEGDPIVEDVRGIREAAERAATLTRQLLAFSRHQVLEPKVVNLDKIVSGMEQMLDRLLGERIELAMSTGRGANVLIDPGQFEQVIMNLVVNARDAMPDGGRLAIETRVVSRDGREYVQVSVSDTGVGMDDDTRQRMFDPFFTTKERGKGTGLGLATVFGIVEQSGGFVRVDSVRGSGTTVAVFIPRTERAEPIGIALAEPAPLDGRGETILVCEDEELVRRLVVKLLRREGYEVLGAANAGEALLLAEQRPDIDLLLTDVVMPIMNGRELAERLRAASPGLRVMFMSGYHEDEALRGMPGVVHLQKPVPRSVLVEKLRELLDS
ncbi:MAG: PAS domain S-box protein [Deltaproteobacteria bacterium]|nr:PAS domain S-box protein [Deltaproteobacteria bacterium]